MVGNKTKRWLGWQIQSSAVTKDIHAISLEILHLHSENKYGEIMELKLTPIDLIQFSKFYT